MNIKEHFKHTFEPELLLEMENKARFIHARQRTIILKEGQVIKIIPIIISGSVKVSREDEEGRELLLYYITPNETCAMTFTCCMGQRRSKIKVVAEDDVEMLAVPVGLMNKWLSKYPSWRSFVMNTVRERFNELISAIDQIAFQKLDNRLVHYLKEKSKTTRSPLINLSHEQIANELATSRVVISRLLKKMENDKKLLLYRNQIKLLGVL